MKKTLLIFVVAILLLATVGYWIYSSGSKFGSANILQLILIAVIVGFAVFVGIKRLASTRRGEPAEDELSKKILARASSLSYYVSIYLWLVIMYFSDKTKLENHSLIGAGILGMALIFALCWAVFYFRGIRNE
jgi:peptidoglycan/LPS O-acetylase OafA/YrhL